MTEKIRYFNSGNIYYNETFEYKAFDKAKNWIKKIEYKKIAFTDGVFNRITEREIEYY